MCLCLQIEVSGVLCPRLGMFTPPNEPSLMRAITKRFRSFKLNLWPSKDPGDPKNI